MSNMDYEFISNNLEAVRDRIAKATAVSGRKPEDILIIGVTKTIEIDKILKLIDAGINDLGENRVQEFCEKYDNINRACNWHLIGHLQTNKVKFIIGKVKMIHSLDRLELAREIQRRAEASGKTVDVLVQVNVAAEESKSGISPEETESFLRELAGYSNIKVRGLMTIAPYVENPEDTRVVFRELRKIFIDIKRKNIDNICMDFLSMGMSNDFDIAIEEGSNMVRIGTAIFGTRKI